MAEQKKKRRVVKKTETVRERAVRASETQPQARRLRRTASKVSKPLKVAHRVGKKEYYLPLPDNRVGRFLNKRRSFIPTFFKESWAELRQVVWPSRRETIKLTIAVFVFATAIAFLIALADLGLDKVFKQLLVK